MKVKTKVKAGNDRIISNHNQTAKGLRVKSKVKAGTDATTDAAGRIISNHNQTLKGLRVRSSVKAGGIRWNHNQSVTR
ncbi:MAG TPA: hypothetical protein VF297_14770 [Pyrinomonadaceae bacterium]